MNKISRKHCVFIKTDLRYDGRVRALIKTLSVSFPEGVIYVYNLIDYDINVDIASNVRYKRYKAFSRILPRSHFVQILKAFEFAIFSFFTLLFKNPYSIQVHHEPVILGPLLYKILFRNVLLVYDDKELYHPKESNIVSYVYKQECLLLKKADLVIFANQYRRRAVNLILRLRNEHLVIENYVFDPIKKKLDDSLLEKINDIREKEKMIFLHQGTLSANRGLDKIVEIIKSLPRDWIFAFIGINDKQFDTLKSFIPDCYYDKIVNIGYVPYEQLNEFWKQVDATLIVYDDSTFNNKYSAPNRLYSAANAGVPIIVNRENVTLTDFIFKYETGILIPPIEKLAVFFDNYDAYHKRALLLRGAFEYKEGILNPLKAYYCR